MNTLVLAARKAQSKAGYYFTYTLTGGPSAPFSILQVLIVTLALTGSGTPNRCDVLPSLYY